MRPSPNPRRDRGQQHIDHLQQQEHHNRQSQYFEDITSRHTHNSGNSGIALWTATVFILGALCFATALTVFAHSWRDAPTDAVWDILPASPPPLRSIMDDLDADLRHAELDLRSMKSVLTNTATTIRGITDDVIRTALERRQLTFLPLTGSSQPSGPSPNRVCNDWVKDFHGVRDLCLTPPRRNRLGLTIVSMSGGWRHPAILGVVRNHVAYAGRQGHRYCHLNDIVDPTRPPAWSKVLLWRLVLRRGTEWMMSIDADAWFNNFDRKVEDILAEHAVGKLAVFPLNTPNDGLHTGVFLLRRGKWSQWLLDSMYNNTYRIHHPWWEQQALTDIWLRNNKFPGKVATVPVRVLHSLPQLYIFVTTKLRQPWHSEKDIERDKDFIVHLAGVLPVSLKLQWLRDRVKHPKDPCEAFPHT